MKIRKCKRERKKKLRTLYQAKQPIPPELLQPIPDPEAIWKINQEQMTQQLQQLHEITEEKEEEEEEIEIILDTVGDQGL